jgi:hypothetical protein
VVLFKYKPEQKFSRQMLWQAIQQGHIAMFQVYPSIELSHFSLNQLKKIAFERGLTPAGDKRQRQAWIDTILAYQSQVEKVEVEVEEEKELRHQIDQVADAAQSAIMAEDWERARELDAQLQELNEKYEDLIQDEIRTLDQAFPPAPTPEPTVFWVTDTAGSVALDNPENPESWRCFVVNSSLGFPVVRLWTAGGVELISTWSTTKNNRYIAAVLAAIEKRSTEVWEGGEIVAYQNLLEEDRSSGRVDKAEVDLVF